MKFKSYLIESSIMNREYSNNRTKSISDEEATKLINNNCKKNIKRLFEGNIKLFRGIETGPKRCGLVDSNSGSPRKSANTFNYMTLLMDNLPSWNGWPKRSKSIICSTDLESTDGYGSYIYYVIPYDNAKIGVCSDYDLWQSFKYGLNHSVRSFNNQLYDLLNNNGLDDQDDDYKTLIKTLEELVDINSNGHSSIIMEFFGDDSSNVLNHINQLFDPKKNGFKMGIEHLQHDKEVWIQGKSILINEQTNDFIKNIIV